MRQLLITFLRLPRRQGVGRDRILIKIKIHRCQMTALLADRKIHLGGADKKTGAAMNVFHAHDQTGFSTNGKQKIRYSRDKVHRMKSLSQGDNST